MANQITLLQFLQAGPPRLVAINGSGGNTTNDAYSFEDIRSISIWPNLTYHQIVHDYGGVLNQVMIVADPMPQTPPKPVTSEHGVQGRFFEYIDKRVSRALRATFNHMRMTNISAPWSLPLGYTELSFGEGQQAATPDSFIPDRAFYEVSAIPGQGPNRAPGEVKPSYKWSSQLATGRALERREYNQALSQLNFYMKQHNTRHGFICTNEELFLVRRLNDEGSLQLSSGISWDAQGAQMTILLALWYIGMLASHDTGYQF
ncbi:hypothetical protein C1H76_0609 [Elsinoe australis]|uniref:Uncharacterized protein n=1 Tax=Elsinoe australis TaxID=40998 RepID=A0A4U7BAQ0_9PEZI|nr:hypothetical protein C1H76_0609 [Elsinoe australis]